jgi:hypothetical protein
MALHTGTRRCERHLRGGETSRATGGRGSEGRAGSLGWIWLEARERVRELEKFTFLFISSRSFVLESNSKDFKQRLTCII